MAYQIQKGTVVPNDEANKLEEPETSPCSPVSNLFTLPTNLKTKPVSPNIGHGNHVIRKCKPHIVGTVESVTLNHLNQVQTVWVSFRTAVQTPYTPLELEQVVEQ